MVFYLSFNDAASSSANTVPIARIICEHCMKTNVEVAVA